MNAKTLAAMTVVLCLLALQTMAQTPPNPPAASQPAVADAQAPEPAAALTPWTLAIDIPAGFCVLDLAQKNRSVSNGNTRSKVLSLSTCNGFAEKIGHATAASKEVCGCMQSSDASEPRCKRQ